jgi:hypothetical protein
VNRKQHRVRRLPMRGTFLGLAGVVVPALAALAVVLINGVQIVNSGSSQSGGQSTGQSSSQSSQLQAARDFASCMRSHGDPGFPDPNGDGNFGAITPGSPADPNSAPYKAAQPSCQSLMPQLGQQQQPQDQSKSVQFAACMRSHGVKNFPDPNSQGGFLMDGDVDYKSPTFQAAMQACKSLLPGRP